MRRASGTLLALAVLAASACADADLDGRGELPDTLPVTGTGADLPEGRPLPPESAPTPPEGTTTGSDPH